MSLWRSLAHGLRSLLRPDESYREAAEEVEHFFDLAVAEYESQGSV